MFNKKKYIALSASLLLFLAACGNGADTGNGDDLEGASDDPQEVTVWAWDPAFNIRAFEIAEELYQEENPDFELNIIENAQDDIIQSLNTSLSSGVQTGLPNIVLIEDYRAPSFLTSYEGSFYPLGEHYNSEDFANYKVAAGTHDGEEFNIPFDSGVTGLYVRTDYLEEAGYSVEDLEGITWEEYIEIGIDVHEQTGVSWITNDHNDLGLIRVMIQSSGEWLTEEDGITPNLAGNEALEMAFEHYKEMYDAGIMNVHLDWDQLVSAINSGEVATAPMGNWFTPSIMQEESQAGDWAVVPIPRQDLEGSVNASNLGGSSLYVLNLDDNDLAVDFLASTFGSDVSFYEELVREIGAVSAYEPAIESEGYEEEVEYFGGQQIYQDFGAWTQEIPEVEFGLRTYEVEDVLTVALQDYLGGADLNDVLENAQTQAESGL